ncbi:hypothetical protein J2X31_001203 [Flavobacterium arsenatis]|uniref:Uncharacterized protein n=1 Tax=Flavobacterium arsenatis TaxID=1484332 RepID=A0ABU1TMV6_9FLAO|nr:hypothetical protein [Flavobacterium arsenatis]MDR6967196.1 hypothetical protein [Flavobacterium arsenatis]
MKKILIFGIIMLFAIGANAQQKGTRYNDTIASPPTPPPSAEINRANKIEGVKMQSNGAIDAEKQAKDKGSTKNQTQVNPEKMAPIVGDTVRRPKPIQQ